MAKKIDRERVYQLRKEGHTVRSIARLLGVTDGAISKILTPYERAQPLARSVLEECKDIMVAELRREMAADLLVTPLEAPPAVPCLVPDRPAPREALDRMFATLVTECERLGADLRRFQGKRRSLVLAELLTVTKEIRSQLALYFDSERILEEVERFYEVTLEIITSVSPEVRAQIVAKIEKHRRGTGWEVNEDHAIQ